MSKALVVIDVQKYFVVDRAANLPNKIAWHIKENDYDHVLFLKFRNDPQSNFHKLLNFSEVTKAPATDIHETLTEFVTDNNVFEKTTYSAFKAEKFVEYLKEHEVDALDLCGISFDACVLSTAFEAFDLGYEVNILDHLCSVSSISSELEDAAKIIVTRDLRKREFRSKREV